MLDGLEVSVINIKNLERSIRFDAEFYSKENLRIESFIKKGKFEALTELVKVSDGNHMSISEKFTTEGVPYYRGQDIHSFFIENSTPICIDEQTFNLPVMKRSHLKKGDVLLSIVGTIGKLGLVYSNLKATCSCKLAILRPSKISAEFLSIFLSSKFGNNQIKKYTRGAVQMGLILDDFDQLLIPKLSTNFQAKIENIVKSAHQRLEQSQSLYAQAEALLLSELGLQDWQPSEANTAEVSLVDSFLSSGRLDAEYYQPKYDELLEKITHIDNEPLINLVTIGKSIETGSEAYSDEGVPYIRVSDISKFGIEQPTTRISNDYYLRNKTLLDKLKVKKNTILLSKDGSIGIAYTVHEDLDMLTSGALLHLKIKNKRVLPDYLTLVLNSNVVQQQAERDGGGSIIVHWRVSEIEKVIIPILSEDIQGQISNFVCQSQAAQAESKRLLALAKEAVEVAIEQSEEAAEKLIASSLANL